MGIRSTLGALGCGLAILGAAGAAASAPNWRPTSFAYGNARAVFADFIRESAVLDFDLAARRARSLSTVEFEMPEEGMPVFDLVENPAFVSLDGVAVSQAEIPSPDGATRFRVLQRKIGRGRHTLKVDGALTKTAKFSSKSAALKFDFDDMAERGFLERYLPSGFENDAFKLDLTLNLRGDFVPHLVLANGSVTRSGPGSWKVSYPAFYNSSSPYLEFGAASGFDVLRGSYVSARGKKIPITVYKDKGAFFIALTKYMDSAKATLQKLEDDLGEFPYPSLLIQAIVALPRSGMEYAGAATSVLSVVPHEIFHSYFGRGLRPANGDANWIDEALASWFEASYPSLDDPDYDSFQFAGISPYRRRGTYEAYWKGKRFVSYLNGKLARRGGLLPFLRMLARDHMHEEITTENFEDLLESWSGISFGDDFATYVYGRGGKR